MTENDNDKVFIPDFPTLPMRKSISIDITRTFTTSLHNSLLNKEGASALQSLTRLRNTILTNESSLSYRDACWKYTNYLSHLSAKVPITQTFDWFDTFIIENKKQKQFSSTSIEFEKANVLYNMGCCCYSLANNSCKTTDGDSLKSAVQHFQNAAGAFQKASECATSSGVAKGDLDSNRLSHLVKLALGSAHLVMHINAVLQKKSKGIIGKLASGAQNQLCESVDGLKKFYHLMFGNGWFVEYSIVKNYAIYLCQTFAANDAAEQQQFGVVVTRLKWAMEAADNTVTLFTKTANKATLKALYSEAKAAYNKAQKENDEIYMCSEPSRKDLPILPETLPAKPVELDEVKDVFESLLPKELAQPLMKYNTAAQTIIADSKNVCDQKNMEGNNIISTLKMLQKGAPQELIMQSERMKQQNVFGQIDNNLRTITTLQNEIDTVMNEADGMLSSEQAEDRRYRQQYSYQWTRQGSEAASAHIRKDGDGLKQALRQGRHYDDEMFNQFNQRKEDIKVLTLGVRDMFNIQVDVEFVENQWKELLLEREQGLKEIIEVFEKNEQQKCDVIKTGKGSMQCVEVLLNSFNNAKSIIQNGIYKQEELFSQYQSIAKTNNSCLVDRLKEAAQISNDLLTRSMQSLQFNEDAMKRTREYYQNCKTFKERRHEEVEQTVKEIQQHQMNHSMNRSMNQRQPYGGYNNNMNQSMNHSYMQQPQQSYGYQPNPQYQPYGGYQQPQQSNHNYGYQPNPQYSTPQNGYMGQSAYPNSGYNQGGYGY